MNMIAKPVGQTEGVSISKASTVTKDSSSMIFGLLATLSLLTGITIYVAGRPESRVARLVHNLTGLSCTHCLLARHDFKWITLSLPQGLWALSGALFLAAIWGHQPHRHTSLWSVAYAIMCLAFEPLQWLRLVPGTADVIDVLFTSVGLVVASAVIGGMKGVQRS